MLRAWFNRWRRRLVHGLLHRMVFGEASAGVSLPNTRIAPSTCIEHDSRLQLADHVYVGPFCFIEASAGVTIGEGVQVTHHVSIVTHSSHRAQRLLGRAYVDWPGPRPGWIAGAVEIGPYCFIGPHSLLEAGTRTRLVESLSSFSRLSNHSIREPRLTASAAACPKRSTSARKLL